MTDINIKNSLKKNSMIIIMAITLVFGFSGQARAEPTVNLGSSGNFVILSGTPNITDAGNASAINGNVGLSPATGAGIGLFCSQVIGVIYSVDATGPLPCRVTNGPLLVSAKNDLTTAFIDAAGRTPVTTVPTELGGTTKIAGVYDSNSTTFQITAGAGALVIDGQGDPSSVFIFEMGADGTGLVVGPGSTISLINGASACNIFWRVDTATIDTTAIFKGNILALNSISVNNGANIEGRLLARNGNVTLINDTISAPICETIISPSASIGTSAGVGIATSASNASGASGAGAVVPGLPNAGIGPVSNSTASWESIVPITFLLSLLSYFIARKNRQV